MASISARMALRSMAEARSSARSRRMSSSLRARARTSSTSNCLSGAAVADVGAVRAAFGGLGTGVRLAGSAPGQGGRGRIGEAGHAGVRRRRARLAAAGARLELMPAHGDLRHRRLEIEWRRGGLGERVGARLAGLEQRRSGLSGSIRAAGPRRSARAGRCPAPRCRAPEFGRRIQTLAPPGLRRARAASPGARSRNQKGPDSRAPAAPARAPRAARCDRDVRRPHRGDRRSPRRGPDRRAGPFPRGRRWLGQANRQGPCRRGGRPRPRRPGSTGSCPRYSTPWLYSCPRPSLGGRESPWNRRRRGPSTLSGLMVKKRLKTAPSPAMSWASPKLHEWLWQLSVAFSLR